MERRPLSLKRTDNATNVSLLVVTTSFPTIVNPAGGVFIQYLVGHLPDAINASILTPATSFPEASKSDDSRSKTVFFRYAPQRLQVLAQLPGGIPAVIKHKPWAILILPAFSMAMLANTFRLSVRMDIVHAQWSFSGMMAGLAGNIAKRPVVTTLRGSDIQLAERSMLFRCLLRMCAFFSQRLVVVGSALAEKAIMQIPNCASKIVVIPNGVHLAAKTVKKTANQFKLIYIGNLIDSKGVDVVIRAMAELSTNLKDLRLVIVGDGPLKKSLIRLAFQLGVADHVKFTGILEPHKTSYQLTTSHTFVFPSKSEGRPNVVLEAMATGVPVIASDIDGVGELIQNEQNGLLFPVGNVAKLASHIARLHKDRALAKRLADKARQWIVEQELTWDKTAQHYAFLYRQVIDAYKKGRGPCAE